MVGQVCRTYKPTSNGLLTKNGLKFKIFLISNSWNQELEANWNFLEDIICQDKHFKKTVPRRVVGRRGGDSHEYFFSRQNGELQSLCSSRPSNFFLNVTVAVKMRSVGAAAAGFLDINIDWERSNRNRRRPFRGILPVAYLRKTARIKLS